MKRNLILLFGLFSVGCYAQDGSEKPKFDYSNRFTLLTGLIQPVLLGGVNLAGTYYSNRFTYEYSHGMYLKYPSFLRKDDHVNRLYSPWSTGGGIGYRISSRRDLRVEGKAHRYDVDFDGGANVSYTTYSLGVAFYSRHYLWNSENWLLEYSFRYWPNIGSTLTDNKFNYTDGAGNEQTHKVHQLGFIFNVSVGYCFNPSKNK